MAGSGESSGSQPPRSEKAVAQTPITSSYYHGHSTNPDPPADIEEIVLRHQLAKKNSIFDNPLDVIDRIHKTRHVNLTILEEREGFPIWLDNIDAAVNSMGAGMIWRGVIGFPDDGTKEQQIGYYEIGQALIYFIRSHLSLEIRNMFDPDTTKWIPPPLYRKLLIDALEKVDPAMTLQWNQRVRECRMAQFSSIVDFGNELINTWRTAARYNADVSEKQIVMIFIQDVEQYVQHFYRSYIDKMRQHGDLSTWEWNIAEVLNQASLEFDIAMRNQALAAVQKRAPKKKTNKDKKDEEQKEQGTKIKVKKEESSKEEKGRCKHCNSRAHTDENCYFKHPEKRPDGWATTNKTLATKFDAPYIRKKGKKKNDDEKKAAAAIADDLFGAVGMAASMSEEVTNTRSPLTWIDDSGCSDHICRDRSLFATYTPVPEHQQKRYAAGGGTVSGIGIGTVFLNHILHNGTTKIQRYDCQHVPDFPVNTIASGKLRSSHSAVFDQRDQTLRRLKDNVEMGSATIRNNNFFYRVKELPNVDIPRAFALATTAATSPSLYQLHHRLGHRQYRDCLKAAKKAGIKLSDTIERHCETCAIAKAKRQISRRPQRRATRPFQIIHTDTSSVRPIGYNRHHYCLHIVDDYSRYQFVTTCASKAQIAKELHCFCKHVEARDRRIETIRMDNGTEHGGNVFADYCKEHGIDIETSSPYTPEQDGVAERAIGAVSQVARAILLASDLPATLWPEAYRTAAYTINRLPAASIPGGHSPRELLLNEIGDNNIGHLHTFGTNCYVHIPAAKRQQGQKVAPRAWKGKLVGYEGESGHIFRIWNPTTNTVHRSRDISFNNDSEMEIVDILKEVNFSPTNDITITEDSLTPIDWQDSPSRRPPTINRLGGGLSEGDQPRSDNIIQSLADDATNPPANSPQREQNLPDTTPQPMIEQSAQVDRSEQQQQEQQQPEQPEVLSGQTGERTRQIGQPENTGPRRSTRTRKAPARFDDEQERQAKREADRRQEKRSKRQTNQNLATAAISANSAFFAAIAFTSAKTPRNIREALKSPEKDLWLKACKAEFDVHTNNNTWTLVPPPKSKDAKILDGTWSFRKKFDANGRVQQHKARWCVRGDRQRPGFDVEELSSPVARLALVRLILALVACNDLEAHNMDVPGAYLQAGIGAGKDVYVKQPPSFQIPGKEDWVCKLNKAMYGLRESAYLWFGTLTSFLERLSYRRSKSDVCVYISDDLQTWIVVYVDDLLVAPTLQKIKDLKQLLREKFSAKDLGEVTHFLGLRIARDKANRRIYISQKDYLERVLEEHGLLSANSRKIPMATKSTIGSFDGEASEDDVRKYAHLIGQLMWPAVVSRPDLAYSVSRLARYTHNPGPEHFQAAKEVLRYLAGTIDYAIKYEFANDGDKSLRLLAYADADYGTDPDNARSTTGYVVLAGGGPISWKSARQQLTATSTTEAELYAMDSAAKEVVWIKNLVAELGYTHQDAQQFRLLGDNDNAIGYSKGAQFNQRTKHLAVRVHSLRDLVCDKELLPDRVNSVDNIADIFTKPLPQGPFNDLTQRMNVGPVDDGLFR